MKKVSKNGPETGSMLTSSVSRWVPVRGMEDQYCINPEGEILSLGRYDRAGRWLKEKKLSCPANGRYCLNYVLYPVFKLIEEHFGPSEWSDMWEEEYSKYYKSYYVENIEEIWEYQQQYYQDHKEEIRQYRQDHKEEISEQKRQYYQDHKKEYRQRYLNRKNRLRNERERAAV